MKEFILVKFPESQYFDVRDCHICIDIDGALFVPKDLYIKYRNDMTNQSISDNISKN